MTDSTATLLSPSSENPTGAAAPELTEAFAERLFGSYLACLEVLSLQLGNELGLYRALDRSGWSTPAELAAATGIHERYAREWLEQQAVAGMLEVDDPATESDRRRYRVPPAHRPVLLDEESPAYQAAGAVIFPVLAGMLPALAEAFRTGGGVAFAAYGGRFARAVAQLNAPTYRAELGNDWLPSIPVVDAALRRPGARVLDLGCGQGASSVEIARAYPVVQVVGLDLDAASVEAARSAAAAAGVADRVTFQAADAAGLTESGAERYDLVTILEALHDLGDPVGALRAARRLLRDGGRVLVAENRVAESFAAPGDELDRFCYGASLLHCLPATMAQSVSASGAVVRPATVSRWSREAGFTRVEQLPIESPLWRLYLMVP